MVQETNNVHERKVKMYFLPAMAGISHAYPLIHTARFFASHPDVQVTIITTSKYVQTFTDSINQDREAGHDIQFHIMELPKAEVGIPDDVDVDDILTSNSNELKSKLFRAYGMLKEPLLAFLRANPPDCIVSDSFASWTLNVANEVGIPRLAFHPSSVFARCAADSLKRFKPHESVNSEDEPFTLPGLPDKISFTRLGIPNWYKGTTGSERFVKVIEQSIENSYGLIANSFSDLEVGYEDYYKNVMERRRLCMVGPVGQYSNKSKTPMPKSNSPDTDNILRWLDSMEPNSVSYISFGSVYTSMCKEQLHELAHGLEASGYPFIWVVKINLSGDHEEDESWFPEGFEERMKLSKQGLVIKQWAPQQLILSHPNVGAFVTHCGWSSCLETMSNGVPLITWPLSVDHFFNESLMVDVLKVGIKVGNEEWMPENATPKVTVTRDKVAAAIKNMMSCEEDVAEMRRRAKEFVEKSKLAIQVGGSSHSDAWALVEELKALQNSSATNV